MSNLDLTLIQDYTGGIRAPRDGQQGDVAIVDSTGANLEYVDPALITPGAGVPFATSMGPFQEGRKIVHDGAGRLDFKLRPKFVDLEDYFCSGGETTGTIGSLGWSFVGASTTMAHKSTSASFMVGAQRIITNTDTTVFTLGRDKFTRQFRLQYLDVMQFVVSTITALNQSVHLGFSDDLSTDGAGGDSIQFVYDAAVDGLWRTVTVSSGGTPEVNVGPSRAGNQLLTVVHDPTTPAILMYVDGVLVGSHTVALPSGEMGVGLKHSSSAPEEIRLAYFGYRSLAMPSPLAALEV